MDKQLKYIAILVAGLICCCSVQAQKKQPLLTSKVVNWGLKAGINALSSSYLDMYQGETTIEDVSYINKTGFTGGAFFRINLSNFFMQPEAIYSYSKERYSFEQPPTETSNYLKSAVRANHHSLIIPVLAGYNIIRQDRYLFNVYLGPSFQYHYKTSFDDQMNSNFIDNSHQYSINGTIGISFSISHIFFDFRYLINRPNTNINFGNIEDSPEFLKNISIKKNENMLSFSCGLMF